DLVPGRPETVSMMPRGLEAQRQAAVIAKNIAAIVFAFHAMPCERLRLLVGERAKWFQYFPEVAYCSKEIRKRAWAVTDIVADAEDGVDRQVRTDVVHQQAPDR